MIDLISFHHFGLAVKSFENALIFYKTLNYKCSKPIIDELQKVELILCRSSNSPDVELIKPLNDNSPISNILKNNNEMIYHTCYEVKTAKINISEIFPNNRAICVSKPKPAILFDGRLVSFYYLKGVGLIEILQKAER